MSVQGLISWLPIAVKAKAKERESIKYVAECTRIITENMAKYMGGSYIKKSLDELLEPRHVETRSGDEIAADIAKRCGLEVI